MGEKNMKRADQLEPDGNLEADTETGVKYRGEQGGKQGPLKRGDYIQPSSARLDGETETSDKYSAKNGRRPDKSKPKTAIQIPEGRLEDRTLNQEYLSSLEYGNAHAKFENVDHLKSEGDMEKNTEYNDRINTAARRGDPGTGSSRISSLPTATLL